MKAGCRVRILPARVRTPAHLPGMSFRIAPFPAALADQVRSRRRDASGNVSPVRRDEDRHQCRACLALTEPWEPHLLLSYRPFDSAQPYAETGPVFLHERACAPYATPDLYPPEMPRTFVVLRAYDCDDAIADATLVGKREIEEAIEERLAAPRVAYLHVRNAGYGCFICRVDRVPARPLPGYPSGGDRIQYSGHENSPGETRRF